MLGQLIETSSSCPQLCCPQPLWWQSNRWVSVPLHARLSSHIESVPGPYRRPM